MFTEWSCEDLMPEFSLPLPSGSHLYKTLVLDQLPFFRWTWMLYQFLVPYTSIFCPVPVSFLLSPVACLLFSVSYLLLPPISCLLSKYTRYLLSPVSCLMSSPVFCLISLISGLQYLVPLYRYQSTLSRLRSLCVFYRLRFRLRRKIYIFSQNSALFGVRLYNVSYCNG